MKGEVIFYLLICIFGWGLSVFTMGFLGKTLSFETAMFYQNIGAFCIGIVFNFIQWISTGVFVEVGWRWDFFFAAVNGLFFAAADISYYQLSKTGLDISSIGPMSSLYILVPVVLGVLFLKESFTLKKFLGVCLALGAIYLLGSEEHHSPPKNELHQV